MQTPMDSCHLLQLTGAFGRRVDHLPDADPLDWSRNDGILSAPKKKGRSQKDREQVPYLQIKMVASPRNKRIEQASS